jgi:hypothetical protein
MAYGPALANRMRQTDIQTDKKHGAWGRRDRQIDNHTYPIHFGVARLTTAIKRPQPAMSTCISTRTFMLVCMYACMYACVYARVPVCKYARARASTHTHTHTYTHSLTHSLTQEPASASTHGQTHTCGYPSTHPHIHASLTHTHRHIQIHKYTHTDTQTRTYTHIQTNKPTERVRICMYATCKAKDVGGVGATHVFTHSAVFL